MQVISKENIPASNEIIIKEISIPHIVILQKVTGDLRGYTNKKRIPAAHSWRQLKTLLFHFIYTCTV
jgi:hypothetical protein